MNTANDTLNTKRCKYFSIISARGGCGAGAIDALGFSCPETGDIPQIVSSVAYEHAISAHAPSEIICDVLDDIEIAAATNASFTGTSVDAWIGWHWIGTLTHSSSTTHWIKLAPGRYTLKIETERRAGAHTLWLIRHISNNGDNAALVTVASYPKEELKRRCRRLFSSAARHGTLVFVDGVDRPLGSLSEAKIVRLRDFIESIPISYKYIAFTDAIDSILLKPIHTIVREVQSECRQIFVSGEDNAWPVRDDDWTSGFLAPFGLTPRPNGPFIKDGKAIHPFLNSGNWVGRRDIVIDCLDKLSFLYLEMRQNRRPEIAANRAALPRNDQFIWQTAYLTGLINAHIDVEWKLFACPSCSHRFLTTNEFFEIEKALDKVSFKTKTGYYPWLLHWPGPGKRWLHLWDGFC